MPRVGLRNSLRAFTLIELSIVLVVIGLIVAGLTSGKALVRAAQLRSIASDFRKYEMAIRNFKSTYDYLPGDMPNATSYWSGVSNGDGNGFVCTSVSAANEHYYAWQHLGTMGAGLVPGNFTATGSFSAANHPTSSIDKDLFGLVTTSSCIGTPTFGINYTNAITLTSYSPSYPYCSWCNGALSAIDAKNVDTKIDDGSAYRGQLFGDDAGDAPASSACSTAYTANPGSDYNITGTSATLPFCRMWFHLEKIKGR